MEYEYGIKNFPHEYDENNLYNENETNTIIGSIKGADFVKIKK